MDTTSFDYSKPLTRRFDTARMGNAWGVWCTRTNTMVVPIAWKKVHFITDTFFAVVSLDQSNPTCGVFCTESQSVIVPVRWHAVKRLTDTLWGVWKDRRCGVYSATHRSLIVDTLYDADEVYSYNDTLFGFWDRNSEWWLHCTKTNTRRRVVP